MTYTVAWRPQRSAVWHHAPTAPWKGLLHGLMRFIQSSRGNWEVKGSVIGLSYSPLLEELSQQTRAGAGELEIELALLPCSGGALNSTAGEALQFFKRAGGQL